VDVGTIRFDGHGWPDFLSIAKFIGVRVGVRREERPYAIKSKSPTRKIVVWGASLYGLNLNYGYWFWVSPLTGGRWKEKGSERMNSTRELGLISTLAAEKAAITGSAAAPAGPAGVVALPT